MGYTGSVSKGVKILLIVLGLCFGGMVGLGVAAYLWVDSNKGRFKDKIMEVAEEATAFAETTDQAGCMAEAEARGKACGAFGLKCEMKAVMFLRICLEEAEPTPGFCDGVPPESDIIESAKWTLEQCGAADTVHNNRCSRLQKPRQGFCQDR